MKKNGVSSHSYYLQNGRWVARDERWVAERIEHRTAFGCSLVQFRREEYGLEVVERSFEGGEVASAGVPEDGRFGHVTLLPVPQRWLNRFENAAATVSAQKSSESIRMFGGRKGIY